MDKIDHLYKYSTDKIYRFYYDKYRDITGETKIGEIKELLAFAENRIETEAIKQRMKELIEWKN